MINLMIMETLMSIVIDCSLAQADVRQCTGAVWHWWWQGDQGTDLATLRLTLPLATALDTSPLITVYTRAPDT